VATWASPLVGSPVGGLFEVRGVRDLREVSTIRSRREDIHLTGARQIQGEHDTFAVGRPARLVLEVTTGARVQRDLGVLMRSHRCCKTNVP